MFGKLAATLTAIAVAALALACGADGGETTAATSAVSETAAVTATGAVGFELGDRIPEFEISLTSGEPLTSAQLRASERPAFLFFFSMT